MGISAADPTDRVNQLLTLTERLTQRLENELKLYEAKRTHEITAHQTETQALANLYRHESVRIKADPSLIAGAPLELKRRLAEATRRFDEVLGRHAVALEAAATLTEGLVRTIAGEVARQRTPAVGYGPGARSHEADASAITLNRKA
ncbi:MAG: flagellar basal body protein [Proteobacteria bacterium]|nr:flagellar basal body protein [Pseudomonadota bacterium]